MTRRTSNRRQLARCPSCLQRKNPQFAGFSFRRERAFPGILDTMWGNRGGTATAGGVRPETPNKGTDEMARKPHLVALDYDQLTEYSRRLRQEQASVLSELALRNEVRNVDLERPQKLFDFYDYPDPNEDTSAA